MGEHPADPCQWTVCLEIWNGATHVSHGSGEEFRVGNGDSPPEGQPLRNVKVQAAAS